MSVERDIKIAEVLALNRKLELKEGLPHLYGLTMYQWQYDYFHRWDKHMLLCAANQIGKSSVQIRKAIHVATEPSMWPELFPHKANETTYRPVIWYLYPNQDTVMQEFEEKWLVEFLPRGKFEDHKQYGWKKIIRNKVLKGIRFATGVTIYFKTYSQNVMDLQAGTCAIVFNDEELPDDLYPEINARLFGSQGYFSMVFTATRGQDFWRKVIEPKEHEEEGLPDAWKRQISMYDCLEYHDGTKSYWTRARIANVISSCRSKAEVSRRVFGKFVKDDGLMFFGFERERNYVPFPVTATGETFTGVPKGWNIYSGVDIGSGGDKNHPSAYTFVSANPSFTKLRVFLGRRLDKIETTAGDVYKYYKATRGYLKPVMQSYDWAAKDFGTIVTRAGDNFVKAKKDREFGINLINTLLKYGILKIYMSEENDKLVSELESCVVDQDKRKAKDDFIDALRYAVATIPVNWAEIFKKIDSGDLNPSKTEEKKDERTLIAEAFTSRQNGEEEENEYEQEMAYWANLHG